MLANTSNKRYNVLVAIKQRTHKSVHIMHYMLTTKQQIQQAISTAQQRVAQHSSAQQLTANSYTTNNYALLYSVTHALYTTNMQLSIKNASVKFKLNSNTTATFEAIEEGGYDELHYENVIKCLLYNILHMQEDANTANVVITFSNKSVTFARS